MKKEKLIEFNRNNILLSADKLFRQNGITKTTMEQIANDASCSKPTLYSYFKDKDEVYYALVLGFMIKYNDSLNSIMSSKKDFHSKYMEMAFSLYKLAYEYPLYFEGLIGDINVDINGKDTPRIYIDIYNLGNEMSNSLLCMIKAGITEGLINKENNQVELLQFLWSSLSGIIRMSMKKKNYYDMLNIGNDQFIQSCFERLFIACTKGDL